jgi:putative redox protein
METKVTWKNGFAFDGRGQGFSIPMDATPPLGHLGGPGPKEIVVMGLAACTGMDVIGLLKKNKQLVEWFEIEASVTQTTEHPVIFSNIMLVYRMEGAIAPEEALKAVELSQTVYCGVSAMLCQVAPINWSLYVNGINVGEGMANFNKYDEIFQSTFDG